MTLKPEVPTPSPTAIDGNARARAEMGSLTAVFLVRARADVSNLAKLICRAQQGDHSVFEEIERVAHTLHGAGAMFGFPDVSATGGALARTAQGLKAGAAAPDPNVLSTLVEFNTQLALHVDAAWTQAPQSGAMFHGR